MTGVTILDTIEIYQIAGWQFLLGFLPLIVTAIVFFTRQHVAFKKGTAEEQARGIISCEHWHPKELLLLVIGGFLSLAFLLCLGKFCPANYVETQYEISIEDTASFNEVYRTYAILEEKENTYIVKERLLED
jgi:hypothetical protein